MQVANNDFIPYQQHYVITDTKLILTFSSADKMDEIGTLELKIDGVVKKVDFHTKTSSLIKWQNYQLHFINTVGILSSLSPELTKKFYKYLKRHSPTSFCPHDFSKIYSKCMYFSALHSGEIIRVFNFVPLRQNELSIINRWMNHSNFEFLTHLMADQSLFEHALSNVMTISDKKFKPRYPREFFTSCTFTANLIATLFFGPKTYFTMQNFFKTNFNENRYYLLPSQKKEIHTLLNPYKSVVMHEVRKKYPDSSLVSTDELKKINELQNTGQTTKFNDHLNRHVFADPETYLSGKISDEEALESIKKAVASYPFYKANLDCLINEIQENMLNTSNNESFGYLIQLRDCFDEINHSFVIEQFFNDQNQEANYRVYQSWIGQATCLEDITKAKSEKSGNYAMNHEQMLAFIKKIEDFFINENQDLRNIFGYNEQVSTPLTTYDNNIDKRRSILYWCEKISPRGCYSNFIELMTKPHGST